MIYGALEAGGTKMVYATMDENGNILEQDVCKTLSPDETVNNIINFFKGKNISSLGIGTFGPVCLDKSSENYGTIGTTPKLQWRNYPLLSNLKRVLNVPVNIDTDVNAAALAEATLGAAKGLESCVYVTIGTGVGGGIYINGKLVHGLMHPEVGHMGIVVHEDDPMKEGICPSHKSCLEGLACGPSIEKRWGISSKDLEDKHKAWDIEAYYIAQMCANLVYICSPNKIILGGGVMQRKHIFPLIHKHFIKLMNSYIDSEYMKERIADYIVEPGLDTKSGIIGAYLLAKQI